jgi:hypothetical protein
MVVAFFNYPNSVTSAQIQARSLYDGGAAMARGLYAHLCPNEETALRKIAEGTADHGRIQPALLAQLHALELIELHEDTWRLTVVGEKRWGGLRFAGYVTGRR